MLSSLPLSYCTNVHPGRSQTEVLSGLDDHTVPVQDGVGDSIAAGLWLAAPVVEEILASSGGARKFADALAERSLACHTLNAFPYGDFHSVRVKEQVYLPDWTTAERLQYTQKCAQILAILLPEETEGSISTVPLGFKGFAHPLDFISRCCDKLLEMAAFLDRLHTETGKLIRLAIEPEPFCVLETTPEALQFFSLLWQRAEQQGLADAARTHLGVCYDVCHQAVEFESIADSIKALTAAEIRINKLHITCALQLDTPDTNRAGREALARYVEQRYLHQTIAYSADGHRCRSVDLSRMLTDSPPREFIAADTWRIHFHVPVNANSLGPLGTTRPQLKEALTAVAALDYAPHLEVETYTWEVLPEQAATAKSAQQRLTEGLIQELTATRQLLTGLDPNWRA